MARGSDQSTQAATTAQTGNTALQSNANALYANLVPQIESEVAHPSGYDPVTLAKMKTGAMQTAGGTNASAVGMGALRDLRTRNTGSSAAAIADAADKSSKNLGQENLAIDTQNEKLKQNQRQAGLGQLEDLAGNEQSGAIGYLGQVAPNVNANTNAVNSSWDWSSGILQPILGSGAGYGKLTV